MGGRRRPRRRGLRLLLAGPGDRGGRRGPRLRRAEALWCRTRKLRLGGAVPHAGHHRRGTGICRRAARAGRDRRRRYRGLHGALRRTGRQARRRRLCRPAALAVRDRRGGRRPRRPLGASRHDRDRRDLARDQTRRRPHGPQRPHRDGGCDSRAGDLLLPELRARDGRGQRLDAADDELGQAPQHPRRLRLPLEVSRASSAASTRRSPASCCRCRSCCAVTKASGRR